VLGYAFSASLHTDVVETALRRAVTFRNPATGATSGVIFHADYAEVSVMPRFLVFGLVVRGVGSDSSA